MNKTIVGINEHQFPNAFDAAILRAMRQVPDIIILIPREELATSTLQVIASAHSAGVRVHIENDTTQAPTNTVWLT